MNWMVSTTVARFSSQPTFGLFFIIYLMPLIPVQCRPINTQKKKPKDTKNIFLKLIRTTNMNYIVPNVPGMVFFSDLLLIVESEILVNFETKCIFLSL